MSHAHLDAYHHYLVSWGAAPTTVRDKLIVAGLLLRALGPAGDVRREQLEQWLASPGFSPWTRATYFSHARSWFAWLHETGRIPEDPTVGMRRPRCPKGKPRPLSAEEVRLVLERAAGDVRAWIMLGMFAGLRVHEVAKLRGEDVDAAGLYVLGKGGKSAMIPTHPLLWELAQDYPRTGWWFPSSRSSAGHVLPTSITARVSRFFTTLGIEGSMHRCRHTYGTNLLRAGANLRVVQTLLRHESLATTALYTAVDEDERTAAIRRLSA